MTNVHNQVVCKGFNPAQGEIAIRQLDTQHFHWMPVASLLRYRAEAYSYPTTMCGEKSPHSGMSKNCPAEIPEGSS